MASGRQKKSGVSGIIYQNPLGTFRAVTPLGQASELVKRLKTANPANKIIKRCYLFSKKAVCHFLKTM
jgi:hypothetical protein